MTDEQFERLMEKLDENRRQLDELGMIYFVAGITILCLQDAPLWSVNSIVPAWLIGIAIAEFRADRYGR